MIEKKLSDLWNTVVERAWADEPFRQNLLEHPAEALAKAGMKLPAGMNLVVVENQPGQVHLVLPARPAAQLSVPDAGSTVLNLFKAAISI